MGGDPDISTITGNDLRRFIIALSSSNRYWKHPYAKMQQDKLSPQSIETYSRAVRAFFGHLHREGFIDDNPMQKIRMPKVPKKVVPTFSDKDLVKLISQAQRTYQQGIQGLRADAVLPGYCCPPFRDCEFKAG